MARPEHHQQNLFCFCGAPSPDGTQHFATKALHGTWRRHLVRGAIGSFTQRLGIQHMRYDAQVRRKRLQPLFEVKGCRNSGAHLSVHHGMGGLGWDVRSQIVKSVRCRRFLGAHLDVPQEPQLEQ